MRELFILFSLFSAVYCYDALTFLDIPVGKENLVLKIVDHENVKTITRTFENKKGVEEVHTWNTAKSTWVDSKGKAVPSSNFTFKAPGTITIKKVTKADAGYYNYEPIRDVTDVQKNLPEGVFIDVDPGLTGIELRVL